jgi:biopolymer transport protein ExbD
MRYRRSIVNQQNAENSQQIDLTPMLDVVFIMLIFFIVTATFVKEAGVDVVRPAADTLESIKNQKIFVAISADNEIWIDKQVLKPVSVRGAIERLRAENSKGSVVIQADANSNAGAFAVVYDAARDAGVPKEQIHVATLED